MSGQKKKYRLRRRLLSVGFSFQQHQLTSSRNFKQIRKREREPTTMNHLNCMVRFGQPGMWSPWKHANSKQWSEKIPSLLATLKAEFYWMLFTIQSKKKHLKYPADQNNQKEADWHRWFRIYGLILTWSWLFLHVAVPTDFHFLSINEK